MYKPQKIKPLDRSEYKIPKGVKTQNQLTDTEIKDKLKNYRQIEDPEELLHIKLGTWIRYVRKPTVKGGKFQYRAGGSYSKLVDLEKGYLMLINPKLGRSWSVQLSDNIIYVPDTDRIAKETQIKDQLFDKHRKGELNILDKESAQVLKMYRDGKLMTRDDEMIDVYEKWKNHKLVEVDKGTREILDKCLQGYRLVDPETYRQLRRRA